MDETYIKLNGKWVYLYRAVDKEGNTIDFLLRAKRDAIAAKSFFIKAFKENGRPDKVTVDKSGSNKAALNYFNKDVSKEEEIEIRQVKYLNNIIEQDHRFIKKRTRPTLGFKNFYAAKETISGIENIRMIQKCVRNTAVFLKSLTFSHRCDRTVRTTRLFYRSVISLVRDIMHHSPLYESQ
jgi:putative transposase